MIESLKALLAEWNAIRGITLEFVNKLSDADMDKKFPRKVLNTVRLQVYELILFQTDIVEALPTNTVEFAEEYHYENKSKQFLIEQMAELDKKLEEALEVMNGTEIYKYYGEELNIHQVISMMTAHENMHIGQMIAFCYATGTEIPESIVELMVLEG